MKKFRVDKNGQIVPNEAAKPQTQDDVFNRVRESLDAGWEYRLNMDTRRYEGRINGSEWQALM